MAVMVIVVAMLVVVMMIVVMVMRGMIVIMIPGRMRVTAGIGAALGIERRFDLDHPRAQSLHHGLDDVIAPDAQPLGKDLGRQMAIAEMPGYPNQMMRIVTANFDQGFWRRDDFDQPAVIQHECIAAS